jgi:hypothetical protein
LVEKLRLGPGQRALVWNAPEGYVEALGELPEGAELATAPDGVFDFVHLFVRDRAELAARRARALDAVAYDGLLWISYPKRSAKVETDLSRGVLWAEMGDTGWRPVAQVSVDATWSAMRFRPTEKVGG